MNSQEHFLKMIEEEQLKHPVFIALIRVEKIQGKRERNRIRPEAESGPQNEL